MKWEFFFPSKWWWSSLDFFWAMIWPISFDLLLFKYSSINRSKINNDDDDDDDDDDGHLPIERERERERLFNFPDDLSDDDYGLFVWLIDGLSDWLDWLTDWRSSSSIMNFFNQSIFFNWPRSSSVKRKKVHLAFIPLTLSIICCFGIQTNWFFIIIIWGKNQSILQISLFGAIKIPVQENFFIVVVFPHWGWQKTFFFLFVFVDLYIENQ